MPMRYPCTDNEDGSKNITGVPVFKLNGEKKGFDFTEQWGDDAVGVFNERKTAGYLPPVIRGHNNLFSTGDKPAEGFVDNLRRDGATLVADLIKVPAGFFSEIEDRRYPYVSIETLSKTNDVIALALLGSSAPFDKFPSLAFQHEDGVMKFTESPDAVWFEDDIALADGDTTPERTNVEDTNVVTPEQFAALQAENETLKGSVSTVVADLAEAQKKVDTGNDKLRGLQVESFSANLSKLGYTPAAIESAEVVGIRSLFADDAVVKFGEVEHSGLDGLVSLFGVLADMSEKGTLFVPKGETATSETAVGVGDGETRAAKAKRFSIENDTTYTEEYTKLLKLETEEK